jgi:hypothetical protein
MRWHLAPLVALASCVHEPPPLTPRHSASAAPAIVATSPAPLVDITVTEDPEHDRWLVAYHFARPVMGVRFDRGHDPFRAKTWVPIADGGKRAVAWRTIDGVEAVVSSDEPFSDLALAFPTDDSKKQSGYWLNATFSDLGRLLYTGHFAVGLDYGDSPECSVLKNVRVVAVDGHVLPKDAIDAYRAILERREDAFLVTLDGRKDALKLTCRQDAELPPFKRLLR